MNQQSQTPPYPLPGYTPSKLPILNEKVKPTITDAELAEFERLLDEKFKSIGE